MDHEQFTEELHARIALVAAAFGHAKRLAIIEVLAQGERTVESVAEQLNTSMGNTSHHLQVLTRAGLVSRRGQGTTRIYRLADPCVLAGYQGVTALAASLPDVAALISAFLGSVDPQPAVTMDHVSQAGTGTLTLLDVRPTSEYAAGHLPGALSTPLPELDTRMGQLPRDVPVVTYSRGQHCGMAAAAASRLRQAGYTAQRMATGFPEWVQSGRPVT